MWFQQVDFNRLISKQTPQESIIPLNKKNNQFILFLKELQQCKISSNSIYIYLYIYMYTYNLGALILSLLLLMHRGGGGREVLQRPLWEGSVAPHPGKQQGRVHLVHLESRDCRLSSGFVSNVTRVMYPDEFVEPLVATGTQLQPHMETLIRFLYRDTAKISVFIVKWLFFFFLSYHSKYFGLIVCILWQAIMTQ